MHEQHAIRLEAVSGADVTAHLDAVAAFRLRHFRDYPYLYDGTMEYEREYLAAFALDPLSLIVMAFDDDRTVASDDTAAEPRGRLVAVSTALPLVSKADILHDSAEIFRAAGHDPATFYYFSETIVEAAYRGRGVGRAIYARREQFAVRHGFANVCFMSVIRPENDPQQPSDYRDNGRFWHRQGFVPTEMIATFDWPTILPDGTTADRTHSLRFWIKPLDRSANT